MTENVRDEWEEILSIYNGLDNYTYDQLKEYVNNNIDDKEVNDLVDKFENTFKDIPDDDPFKFKIMSLLGILGITIYRPMYNELDKIYNMNEKVI